jgi:hypothetical protein
MTLLVSAPGVPEVDSASSLWALQRQGVLEDRPFLTFVWYLQTNLQGMGDNVQS